MNPGFRKDLEFGFSRRQPKLISVMLPTRGRLAALRQAITSILDTVHNKQDIEILLKIDDDDVQTLQGLHLLPSGVDYGILVSPRGEGYRGLHLFYNELARISRGDWLLLFNDDVIMTTPGWDTIIRTLKPHAVQEDWYGTDDIAVLQFGKLQFNTTFPIIRRTVYEIMGRLSAGAHVDLYVAQVIGGVRAQVVVPSLGLHHAQGEDSVYDDTKKVLAETNAKHYSKEIQDEVTKDVEKLRKFRETAILKDCPSRTLVRIDRPVFNEIFGEGKQGGNFCEFYMKWPDQSVYLALVRSYRTRRILEIGVNAGYTAKFILDNCPFVEHYLGVDVPESFVPALPVQRNEVPAAVGAVVHDDRFTPCVLQKGTEDIKEVPKSLGMFDIVLVDGDHSREGIERDTLIAEKVLQRPGIILWHDFDNYPEVGQFLVDRAQQGHQVVHVGHTASCFEILK